MLCVNFSHIEIGFNEGFHNVHKWICANSAFPHLTLNFFFSMAAQKVNFLNPFALTPGTNKLDIPTGAGEGESMEKRIVRK